MKSTKDNILAIKNPELAKQWHPSKNANLTPEMVTAYSNKSVWWQCLCGYEWQAKINNRSNGWNACSTCEKI